MNRTQPLDGDSVMGHAHRRLRILSIGDEDRPDADVRQLVDCGRGLGESSGAAGDDEGAGHPRGAVPLARRALQRFLDFLECDGTPLRQQVARLRIAHSVLQRR